MPVGAKILIVAVFVAVVAVFAFLAAVLPPRSVLVTRLRALGEQQPTVEKPTMWKRIKQLLDYLGKAIPLSPADVSHTRCWLIQAGFRDAVDVNYYFGACLLMAAVGFVVVELTSGFDNVFLLASVAGLGFFLPRFILKRMVRGRRHRIRLGLPSALDFAILCIESGQSLDRSVACVIEELHQPYPDLSDELYLVHRDICAGYSLDEALFRLSGRTGVDDIIALTEAMNQGGPLEIVRVLRSYSDFLRIKRRQRIEERAPRTAVEMVLVFVLLILPSVIFVTIGPAVIELVRQLTPVSSGR